ncbi:MAG: DUF2267 domain-containing protein [Candidatus Rokubacteria bacterium]|nr:DUF2267 domain-containing protein [Candidatus Rokubacteria bacterium]
MTAARFYRRVMGDVGVDRETAQRITAAVFHTLRDRLTPEEAAQAAAQLPTPLRILWRRGEALGRRPVKMHRRAFYDRVRGEAGLASIAAARAATYSIFAALKWQLSPGESEDIFDQLPTDLKEVWQAA